MKLKFLIIFLIVTWLMPAVVYPASPLTDWSYIEEGSDAAKGLERSFALVPPGDPPLSEAEIRALAEEAGNAGDHPEADAVILASRDRTAFDADGYYHLIQQEAIKLLNEEGVKKFSSVPLGYHLPYNRTRVLDAYILSPRGDITKIIPENILDVADSSDAYSNIYEPIWRNKVIMFPEAVPGCTVCYTYEVCAIKPISPGSLDWGHSFSGRYPYLSASCCMKGPADVELHWYVANDPDHKVQFTQTTENGYNIYCWRGGRMPMIIEEPGMIPVPELTTSLLVSTDTWQSYSRRESAIIEPLLVPDDAIKAKVAELIQDARTPEEKLFSIFQYVTKKVRYIGVAYGDRPGVNPDPVTRTFKNNAGVCKDKAGLLTAMLRIAGIEAYYTLTNPTHRIFPQVAVDQFNHAIVAARLPGSDHFIYLDVTADLVRSMLPSDTGGMGVLRVTPEGSDIDFIPVSPPEDNMGYIRAQSMLDETGALVSTIEYSGDGCRDTMYRTALYYIEPQNRIQWFGNAIQKISSGAFITDFSFSPDPVDDLSEPFRMKIAYKIPNYLVKTGKYALFKIPGALSPLDWIYEDLMRAASLPSRRYPLDLWSTSGMTTEERFKCPEGYHIKALPPNITVDTDTLLFQQTYTHSQDEIHFKQVLKVKKIRVSPENYADFRKAVDRIKGSSRTFVVLEAEK